MEGREREASNVIQEENEQEQDDASSTLQHDDDHGNHDDDNNAANRIMNQEQQHNENFADDDMIESSTPSPETDNTVNTSTRRSEENNQHAEDRLTAHRQSASSSFSSSFIPPLSNIISTNTNDHPHEEEIVVPVTAPSVALPDPTDTENTSDSTGPTSSSSTTPQPPRPDSNQISQLQLQQEGEEKQRQEQQYEHGTQGNHDDSLQQKQKQKHNGSSLPPSGSNRDTQYHHDQEEQLQQQSSQSHHHQFPPSFYCPITDELFLDPVVAPDGLTYERDILMNNDMSRDFLYPNRALQAIMEDTLELTADTWEAGIRRFQRSFQTGLQQLLSSWPTTNPSSFSSTSIPSQHQRTLPDAYYCPITMDLLHDPVIDPEGNTYEKSAIVHWIRGKGTSPFSRTSLLVGELYPNQVIRNLLEYHATRHSYVALEKWKHDDEQRKQRRQCGPGNNLTSISMGNDEYQNDGNAQQSSDTAATTTAAATAVPTSVWNEYSTSFDWITDENTIQYHAQVRRQERKMIVCMGLGIVFFILAIVASVFYGGYCIFISIWVGCCVRDSFRRWRRLHQEQELVQRQHTTWNDERLTATQRRIDELQERLESMRWRRTRNENDDDHDHEEEIASPSQQLSGPLSSSIQEQQAQQQEEGQEGHQPSRFEQLEQRLSQLRLEYMEEHQRRQQEREQEQQDASFGSERQQGQLQQPQDVEQIIPAGEGSNTNYYPPRLDEFQQRLEALRATR